MSSNEKESEIPLVRIGEIIIFFIISAGLLWLVVSHMLKTLPPQPPTVRQMPLADPLLEGRELVTVLQWELPIGERVILQRILPYAEADVTTASYEVVGIAP